MVNSFAQRVTVPCFSCKKNFDADIWLIVDALERPDLWERARVGALQTLLCPYCGNEEQGTNSLLLYHPDAEPHLIFVHTQPEVQDHELQEARLLLHSLRQSLGSVWRDEWTKQVMFVSCDALVQVLNQIYQQTTMRTHRLSKGSATSNLNAILAELDELPSDARNMPHRVELCRKAIALVDRTKQSELWAALHMDLGNSLMQNPLGERKENIEQALVHYRKALEVHTRESSLIKWAQTMMNLANAYAERVQGDRAANLELAIAGYRDALQVVTREVKPLEWATVMNNLAVAYSKRIQGERAANLEEAIATYKAVLQVRTREAAPIEWATTKGNLAAAYAERIRGDRAENLEWAISELQDTLQVRTREAMPVEWAMAMSNLTATYKDRIRGDRAENLEQAISACQSALQVYTREAMPIEWAQTMTNLASVYILRIHGDRAENQEQAIVACMKALQVISRETMPYEWSLTMLHLANAYLFRIRGERAENVEKAISAYREAMEERARQTMPVEWAQTAINLASAYCRRIKGDRAENLERAIDIYEMVLQVFTCDAMPTNWALAQNNQGIAYFHRIAGERLENIECAIGSYQSALRVLTRTTTPVDWAMTTMNLATAYANRLQGDRAENMEQAITAYQEALQVRTRETMPVEWAETMLGLATAYQERVRGDRAENLERSIVAFQQALLVRTRQAMPVEWAQTMMNLATTYRNRTPFLAEGERAENLEVAIDAYQQALEVMPRQAMPEDHRRIQHNLSHLYFGERRWQEALQAYTAAIAAGDDLLASAYSEVGRRAEVAQTAQFYARAAYCQLQLGQLGNAIVQLEAGKTRLLSQALALWEADVAYLPTVQRDTLGAKRQTIRELEAEMRLPLDTPARRSDRDLAELLRLARTDLNQLIDTIRRDQPDFMPLGLTLPEILALIPEGGALVAPVITSQGSAVFVVPYGTTTVTEEHIIRLDQFKDENLSELLRGPANDPKWGGWMGAYFSMLGERAPVAHKAWQAAIEQFTHQLWEQWIAPVHARLQELGVRCVIFMPSGGLQLLPLHAAWRMENGARRYFMDDLEVIYAPSAFALKASQARAQSRTGQTALVAGVSKYTQLSPLHFTHAEVEEVGKLFNMQPLMDNTATPEAVRERAGGAAYLHLSCHGSFAWGGDPLASAVYLADEKPLTLADILGNMDLNSARLVTLSACETGICDIRQSPNEYVGLPAGFLQAGAAGVVSSLWSVNDLSTALLMIRFYENHLKGKLPPAQALRQAQLWLRDVTNAELSELFAYYKDTASDAPRMAYATAQEKFREHTLRDPDERPFAHPYYWAAFAFYGA